MKIEKMDSSLEQLTAETVKAPSLWWYESYLPLVTLFWQNRIFLAKLAGMGMVFATLLSLAIRPQYESTVALMPPDSDTMSSLSSIAVMASGALGVDAGGDAGSAVGGLASSLLGAKTPGAPFLAILSSRTVEDDLINRFDLRRAYWIARYVDTRKKLERRTTLDEDKKTGVVTITVVDHDRYRARDMAKAYVEELNQHIAQMNTSSAHQERIFLESRLKTVKRDLDDATLDLSHFSSKNVTLDMENEGKSMVEGAANLQGQLIAAQSDLQAVEVAYTSDNVRVRTAKARVEELDRELRRLGGSDHINDSSDLKSNELYPSLRKLPLLGATYSDLHRRTKVQEAAYEFLTKQYELAKLQEARAIPVVKVLDAPDVAEKRSFPPRIAIIVLGILLALAAGMTWLAAPWRCDRCSRPVVSHSSLPERVPSVL